jgi:hypothetical protein
MWQKRDETNDADTNWNKFWTAPLLYWMVLLSILTNVWSNTYDHEQCRIRFNCLFLNSADEIGLSLFLRDLGHLSRTTGVLTVTRSKIFPMTGPRVRRTAVSTEESNMNYYTSGNKNKFFFVLQKRAWSLPQIGLLLHRSSERFCYF